VVLAPWKRSFCASRQDRNGTVSCRGHRHPRSPQPVSLASPSPASAPPPTSPVPAFAVLVVASTAVFPASSTVEGAQSQRPCPFASGEASGSECLRPPPQIRSRPTHPVRQNTAWHPQVNGGVAVPPAIYYPALQQRAVIWGQISARRLHPTRLHHGRHESRQ
jgi:hypothetical protein